MTDAEVAAAAIAAVAFHDDEGLARLARSVGGERLVRSLARFALRLLRRRLVHQNPAALREQLRQMVQIMDRANAENE